MKFGEALEAMKEGKRIRNSIMSKYEFYFLFRPRQIMIGYKNVDGSVEYRSCMYNYDGTIRSTLNYSFSDDEVLADDWEIVD